MNGIVIRPRVRTPPPAVGADSDKHFSSGPSVSVLWAIASIPIHMTQPIPVTVIAVAISTIAVAAGYCVLGGIVALIFAAGYFGGLALWFSLAKSSTFVDIKAPYWTTLGLFITLHKVEERHMKFFEAVSDLTGLVVPSVTSWAVILMVGVGFLPWLFIPVAMRNSNPFGQYLAWTFFASMGVSELAHFLIFPFLVDGPYRYFPGMGSVLLLAPTAWWGMKRLVSSGTRNAGRRRSLV